MLYKLVLVSAIFCIVYSNNIKLGRATPHAKQIFGRVHRGITRRGLRSVRYVTIRAPSEQLISAVYVTDLSNNNDGIAFVKGGGIGKNNIILGLKSSTAQNESRFQLKVFAEKKNPRGFLQYNKDRVIGVELREAPGRIKPVLK